MVIIYSQDAHCEYVHGSKSALKGHLKVPDRPARDKQDSKVKYQVDEASR